MKRAFMAVLSSLTLVGCSGGDTSTVEAEAYDVAIDAIADSGLEDRISTLEAENANKDSEISNLEMQVLNLESQISDLEARSY